MYRSSSETVCLSPSPPPRGRARAQLSSRTHLTCWPCRLSLYGTLSSLLPLCLSQNKLNKGSLSHVSARVVVSRASPVGARVVECVGIGHRLAWTVVTHKGCSTPPRLPSVHSHSLATRAYTPSSPLPAHSRSAAGGLRGRTRCACARDIAGSRSGWRSEVGEGEMERWREIELRCRGR